MEITWDYFCDEFQRFMDIMGSRNYTIEQRFSAFRGLAYVALRCVDNRAGNALKVASIDFEVRMKYIATQNCGGGLQQHTTAAVCHADNTVE